MERRVSEMRFDFCCHGLKYKFMEGRVTPFFSRDESATGRKVAMKMYIGDVLCDYCPYCGTKVDIRIHVIPEIADKIAREEAMDIEAAMLAPEKESE